MPIWEFGEDRFRNSVVRITRQAKAEEMRGIVLAPRPSIASLELNSDKMAAFLWNAVPDATFVLATRIKDGEVGVLGNELFHVKTGAVNRNVLQAGIPFSRGSRAVSPADFQEICAEVAGVASHSVHATVIGNVLSRV